MGLESYFPIRVQSAPVDIALPFDICVVVNGKCAVLRRIGDVLSSDRLKKLIEHGVKELFVPVDQQQLYRDSLRRMIQDEQMSTEVRGKFVKEAAFNHISDLFTQPDVSTLAAESTGLVEDMVNFITTDIGAAVKLMGLSSHDYYTYNHCVNVSVYSISIAKRVLGEDKKLLMVAGLGGLLHDLGKRLVDLKIINKAGKLDEAEWIEMKKHPSHGVELLKGVDNVPEEAKRIVHEHHEHLDGTGYPRGLTDENISQLSRVAAIADVFDALTTKRSYKEATSADVALEIMLKMSPGKFDPNIFRFLEKKAPVKQDLKPEDGTDPCAPGFSVKKAA